MNDTSDEATATHLKESVWLELLAHANKSRDNAYAPYSDFAVGAALLADDGRIYCGANVENASYGLSVCAERVAIFAAASAGARRIQALVVLADEGEDETAVTPCGACRQVIAEFCKDTPIRCYRLRGDGSYDPYLSSTLLPATFRL